jgi:hypothetical protein
MPTILAIFLTGLLALAIAAPALLAFLRGEVGWRTGGFYGALGAALLAWHVGFAVGPIPDAAALAQPVNGAPSGNQCEQALTAAERGRIVIDRSNPDRLVVDQRLWAQIPAEMRTALTQCADSLRPQVERDHAIEVVNRAG